MNEAAVITTMSGPPARRPRRRNASRAERAEWIRRFAESGLGQREFCRQHGLVLTTLQRWLAQAQGVGRGGAQKVGFLELKGGLPMGVSRWAAELCGANGAILRVADDVPVELVQQLLRAC